MAVVRGGLISSPKSPWSKAGDLGSDASLPETLLQTPEQDKREPSVISEDARTMSLRGDYRVTPYRSRRERRNQTGPYSTQSIPAVRRLQESRRRHLDDDRWSRATGRGSDVPPANWLDNRGPSGPESEVRRSRSYDVKHIGFDPDTGLDYVETKRGTRKYLGEPSRREPTVHPRYSNARTGTVATEWDFVDDPTIRSEYQQQQREYKPRREFKPTRVYARRLSDPPSVAGVPASSVDSVENFKGSDLGAKEPKQGEFVPHWGYYTETPPSPGQSVLPRQGSVLDPNYRSRSRELDRNLLSPRSLSKSMVPTHGSTLTSPSMRGSVKELESDESGFHEPTRKHQGQAYPGSGNHASPDYRPNPYQRGSQGGYQRGAAGQGYTQGGGYQQGGGRTVRFNISRDKGGGPRKCDPAYICTILGVLKLAEFITSAIITGVSQADPDVWSFDVFILFVGVSGMVLAVGSFIFRLFHWEESAHLGCLWFEFSCHLVVAILMFVAAILSTLSASLASSIVALTFFCFLGAGLFSVDTFILGSAVAKQGRESMDGQGQGRNQGQQPRGGGYPGQQQQGGPQRGGYPGQGGPQGGGYPGQGGPQGGGYPGGPNKPYPQRR
ncbi:uncharacterized protein LOC124134050 [Haliotis rufescens]|uniref:uncharacterized protein LOC124134050 n=1 Tax=Haliotis rufescens TaxID=6454 RepID=UPI00201F0838|nr:uncharacterized protein LOC124134050 [Haliotis rufescens]XP_048253464.1 uncharacterized protein LOC124134050 [Haliotis rufescens]